MPLALAAIVALIWIVGGILLGLRYGVVPGIAAAIGLILAAGVVLVTSLNWRRRAQSGSDRLATFMALSADWFWELDKRLRFRQIGGGGFPTERLAPSELLGKPIEACGFELSDPRGIEWFNARLAAREAFHDVEFTWTDDNGERLTFVISGNPVLDTAGSFRGYRGVGRDITTARRIGGEARLGRIGFERASEAIIITNAANEIVAANPAFEKVTGYSTVEILGKNPRILSSRRQDPQFYKDMWAALQRDGHWEGELWNRRRNGEIYPEWLSISLVRDDHGKVVKHLAMFSDISERKDNEEQIHRVLYYDPLTGLPNRRLMRNRGDHAVERAEANKGCVGYAVIDLDDMRVVNDAMGYEGGDQLLLEFRRRLTNLLPPDSTLARQGGDEFAILVPRIEDAGDLVRLAERLLEDVGQPFRIGDRNVHLSCSIGLAIYPDDGQTFLDILRRADAAMHVAKRSGKRRYGFYNPEVNEALAQDRRFEAALRRAIVHDEISVAYQPIVDLATGRVASFEALARWRDPEFGDIPPSRFIPLAEETGQIGALGLGVIRAACKQLRLWRDQGLELVPVAVNVSVAQFAEPALAATILSFFQKEGMPLEYLQVEITEAVLMNNPHRAIEQVDALRSHGVKISLDDFGTGYSSLAYLRQINVDKLKIDRSFTEGVPGDSDSTIIMRAVIDLARALHITTVAEGVETETQRQWLRERGCDQAQGFMFARPLVPDDAAKWLRPQPS